MSLLITIAMTSAFSLTVITYHTDSFGMCGICTYFFPAEESFYTYVLYLVFYSISAILCLFNLKFSPRRTVFLWICFLFFIYFTASIFAASLLYFDFYDGFCFMFFVAILYGVLYPFFIDRTLDYDSIFLNNIFYANAKQITPPSLFVFLFLFLLFMLLLFINFISLFSETPYLFLPISTFALPLSLLHSLLSSIHFFHWRRRFTVPSPVPFPLCLSPSSFLLLAVSSLFNCSLPAPFK